CRDTAQPAVKLRHVHGSLLASQESAIADTNNQRHESLRLCYNAPQQGAVFDWLCSRTLCDPRLWDAHCGIEAGSGCRVEADRGEVEPLEVAAEIFRRDAPVAVQRGLETLMTAVHRLDVQFASDTLASRLVEHLMGDPRHLGADMESPGAVGDRQGVLVEHRPQHL